MNLAPKEAPHLWRRLAGASRYCRIQVPPHIQDAVHVLRQAAQGDGTWPRMTLLAVSTVLAPQRSHTAVGRSPRGAQVAPSLGTGGAAAAGAKRADEAGIAARVGGRRAAIGPISSLSKEAHVSASDGRGPFATEARNSPHAFRSIPSLSAASRTREDATLVAGAERPRRSAESGARMARSSVVTYFAKASRRAIKCERIRRRSGWAMYSRREAVVSGSKRGETHCPLSLARLAPIRCVRARRSRLALSGLARSGPTHTRLRGSTPSLVVSNVPCHQLISTGAWTHRGQTTRRRPSPLRRGRTPGWPPRFSAAQRRGFAAGRRRAPTRPPAA